MGKITNRYKDFKVNQENTSLLNTETGEVSIIKDGYLLQRKSTAEISIDYKEYVYLDTEKLNILLENGIKQVELALLITLASKLQYRYNICMKNDEEPHDTASIAKLISNSTQAVKKKLNSLVKQGVLDYEIVKNNKGWGKVYTINPHFIRIGNKLSGFLGEKFDDIVKK